MQYFNHLPAGLVWVHVSTSVVLWIFVLQLWLSTGTGLPRHATGGADSGAARKSTTANSADQDGANHDSSGQIGADESVAASTAIKTTTL